MRIRPYQRGDEKKIWQLDRQLETHPWNRRELNNWYWKYTEQNPAGSSIIYLVEKDAEIIAHFAVVPYRLKVLDQELIASHSIGAMVVPAYQNLGIMKFLADKLFEEVVQKNIPFTYGFPNSRSYDLHKKFMGYVDLINFATWKIDKIKLKKSVASPNSSFGEIKSFDNSVDQLWEQSKKFYPISVVRTKDYLNWRYLRRPDSEYYPFGIFHNGELKGYVVLKFYQEENILRGHILDIFAEKGDKETLEQLIAGSLNFFYKKNVDEVTCWIWGSDLIEKFLEQKGFSKKLTNTPLVIRINREFPYQGEVQKNQNWYFTMGDSTEIF